MTILLFRRSALTLAVGTLTWIALGCVAYQSGYGYDRGWDLGATYYEPYGADYGGWEPGYRVAPFRGGGDHRPDRDADHRPNRAEEHRPRGGDRQQAPHAFKSAPPSRPIPSLPTHSRSGGSHPHSDRSRSR